MRRGEVRWYTFEPPDKRRLVLILTRTCALSFLSGVTIAPMTSTVRDVPLEPGHKRPGHRDRALL